jgi:hypothetical protein
MTSMIPGLAMDLASSTSQRIIFMLRTPYPNAATSSMSQNVASEPMA